MTEVETEPPAAVAEPEVEQLVEQAEAPPVKEAEAPPVKEKESINIIGRIMNLKRRAAESLASISAHLGINISSTHSSANTSRSSGNSNNSLYKRRRTEETTLTKYRTCVASYEKFLHAFDMITPRQLAENGWVAVGGNTVKCSDCAAVLSTTLPCITKVAVYNKSRRRIVEKMVSSHLTTCYWRSARRVNLALHDRDGWRTEMTKQYRLIEDMALGACKIESCLDEHDSRRVLGFSPSVEPAAVIALAGWNANGDDLCCKLCVRRVTPRLLDSFAPFSSHRAWCPWLDIQEDSHPLLQHIIQMFNNTQGDVLREAAAASHKLKSFVSGTLESVPEGPV